jgi:5-methylcytosine-specific restriction endonuclease McrA
MAKARDYDKEYREYHSKPEQKRNRALRNAARREMEDRGLVRKGDGKDVDHKKPLDRGGSNEPSNWRVMSKSKNRGYRRDSKNQPR